jgi:hypothetical protein
MTTQAPIPPSFDSPTPSAPQSPPVGYRAVAVAPWRVATLGFAILAMAIALTVEVLASLAAALTRSTDEWLWLTSWLYQLGHLTTTTGSGPVWEWAYGYPPLGLWVALLSTIGFLSYVRVGCVHGLRKAGTRIPFLYWSGCDEERRLSVNLHNLGCSKRMMFRVNQRRFLAVGGAASLLVALVSASAVTGRGATLLLHGQGGAVLSDLSVGLGPWLCLAAGIVGVMGVLAAWPWIPQREILIGTGGSVDTLTVASKHHDRGAHGRHLRAGDHRGGSAGGIS